MGEQQAWVDLFFDALSGPDGWKRVTQPTVSLDPTAMGLLARGATALTIERFVDDSPKDLSRYGLDPPLFTLELQGLEGDPVVLAFGHPPSAQDHPIGEYDWFCQRQGYAHVWEVGIRDVELLTQPASLFFDQIVVRTLREDVQRLELAGGGTRRTVQRTKKGWEVWEGAADGSESVHQPGNTAAIEETLAALERLQLAEHFEGEAFEPTAPPASFTLVLQNGARLGGALGRPTRDPRSGAQGLQFLRAGDEVVALIDESALALCTRPLAELRSRKMHQLQEAAVRAIVLTQRAQGRTYTFVNNGDNLWNPEGETIRAPAGFVQSLDGLLNLGAERWLESAPAAEALLDVRVERVEGTPLAFTFLKTGEGAYVCTSEAGQAAEVGGELVERLLALF
jgi:hypothetical protein